MQANKCSHWPPKQQGLWVYPFRFKSYSLKTSVWYQNCRLTPWSALCLLQDHVTRTAACSSPCWRVRPPALLEPTGPFLSIPPSASQRPGAQRQISSPVSLPGLWIKLRFTNLSHASIQYRRFLFCYTDIWSSVLHESACCYRCWFRLYAVITGHQKYSAAQWRLAVLVWVEDKNRRPWVQLLALNFNKCFISRCLGCWTSE